MNCQNFLSWKHILTFWINWAKNYRYESLLFNIFQTNNQPVPELTASKLNTDNTKWETTFTIKLCSYWVKLDLLQHSNGNLKLKITFLKCVVFRRYFLDPNCDTVCRRRAIGAIGRKNEPSSYDPEVVNIQNFEIASYTLCQMATTSGSFLTICLSGRGKSVNVEEVSISWKKHFGYWRKYRFRVKLW